MKRKQQSISRQTQKRKSALKLFLGAIAAAKEKMGCWRILRRRQIPFAWIDSDAWILTSLLLLEMKPLTLSELIYAADWLNHAIPTANEVNHALTLLSANGYLTMEADGNIRLTDLSETFKSGVFQKARHFSKVEVVRRNLMQSMTVPCSTANEYFTDGDITKAHEVIKQTLKDYTKSRRKKPDVKK